MSLSQQWRWQAACRDLPKAWFFDYEYEDRTPVPPQAKEACENCPAFWNCLNYALRHEEYGYWAQTTNQDRRKMRRAMGITLESRPLI